MKDYTRYDYESLVNRITEVMSDKEGFTDNYEGTTAQTLIQLLADTTDYLHFMLERRSQEAFLTTARLDKSVWAHASEVGYRPRRKVSSSGDLSLCLLDSDGNTTSSEYPITIRKGTPVTSNGLQFIVIEDAEIPPGQSNKIIKVKQGEQKEKELDFSADSGTPRIYEYTFKDYVSIEEYSLKVTVGGRRFYDVGTREVYNYADMQPDDDRLTFINVTSLNFADDDDPLYDIRYSQDGMRVVFGDGVFGMAPIGRVVISWIETDGDEVAFMSTGSSFQFDTDTITPNGISAADAPEFNYDMINITPIRGGSEEESVEDIKVNAPRYIRTANRAVTREDYNFLIERSGIGNIVDVNTFGEQETGELVYSMNNVYLTYITGDNIPLSLTDRSLLRKYLNKYKVITQHLIFREADKINILVNLDVKPDYFLPTTPEHFYSIMRRKIEKYFEITRGTIGRHLQHSEFVRYLQNSTETINGIEYDLVDYLSLKLEGEFTTPLPSSLHEVEITLDGYTLSSGDTFALTIDGTEYTTSVSSGQTMTQLLDSMAQEIFVRSSLAVSVREETLFIRSSEGETFSIVATGDLSSYVNKNVVVYIPTSDSNVYSVNKVLPGSVTIIDESDNVIYEDDGQGSMVPTGSGDSFGIDYEKGRMSSPNIITQADYRVRYQQNEYMNFHGDYKTAITLSPLAESYSDDPLYSRINVITRG